MGETKIGELLTCLEHIKYYSKNLSGWMKPSKRHVGIYSSAGQSLGAIPAFGCGRHYCTRGIIRCLLSVGPLICALAAGNHAMIKISSASMHFGRVLENAIAEAFPQELVAVITGGGAISDTFSHLSFDKYDFYRFDQCR
ncbi:hypothetical protein AB2762_02955 [Acinetobacter indicus]